MQQRLADLSGVSRQTINAIEGNMYPPSLELAFKIERVFGVAVEDIFVDEPDPEGENKAVPRRGHHRDKVRGSLRRESGFGCLKGLGSANRKVGASRIAACCLRN